MNKGKSKRFWVFLALAITATVWADPGPMTLWYEQPAKKWTEALPVGNGRLGAMVFGGIDQERIQINEETIWAGPPVPGPHDRIRQSMAKARQAWFAGDYAKAHKVLQAALPPRISPRSYQTLGDLGLEFNVEGRPENYCRELNLDSAIVTTRFTINGVTYIRQVFCSAVDQVIVVRQRASRPGVVSMTVSLTRPADFETKALANNTLVMTGQARHKGKHLGVRWQGRLKLRPKVARSKPMETHSKSMAPMRQLST